MPSLERKILRDELYRILLDEEEERKKPENNLIESERKKKKKREFEDSISIEDLYSDETRRKYGGLEIPTKRENSDLIFFQENSGLRESIGLFSERLRKKPREEYIIKGNLEEYKGNLEKYILKDKNIINYNLNYYNLNYLLNKNFSSIKTLPLGLNLTLKDSASITADNIGEFALPIVEYIHQTQPDYVIACDRGARLLGLAVYRLYRSLHGRFPTSDGTLRFRRFSKSNAQQETEKHVQPLVDEMLTYEKRPTALVLDDWVASGHTKKMIQQTFDRLSKGRVKTKFGVLVGEGADVSGNGDHTSGFAGVTDWRDDSNIIGVAYGGNHYGFAGIEGEAVKSKQARDYRKRMYEGIDRLAERIAKRESV